MDHTNNLERQAQVKPDRSIFFQEQIRISSSGSSNNQDSKNLKLEQLDSIVQALPKQGQGNEIQSKIQHEQVNRVSQIISQVIQDRRESEADSIIVQVQKNWIIKQAEIQRIGGTYNFFASFLQIYMKNLNSRKTILNNISSMVDKNKITKALPIMMLSQYFKDYSSIANDFEEKSLDFEIAPRLQRKNKQVNMHSQLKEGFNLLVNLRKTTAKQMSRLEIYMINTVLKKISAALDKYWGLMAGHQSKANTKKSQFQDKQKLFHKRIDKISKLYSKGKKGEQISEDYFQEMCKFIRQQRQLRYSIYDWGTELLNLRQSIIAQDYTLFNQLELILTQFKNMNNTIFQLQKKKFNFLLELKQDIQKKYLFEVLCTPLDNDYIISVLNYKNKLSIKQLQQDQYEHFIKEQYFSEVVGDPMQLLKGAIAKSFPLKNQEYQLIKTVTGNLLQYNKKTLQISYKMKLANVKGQFQGKGCIFLKQKIIGIFYDSDKVQKVYFKDDNRAQQLLLFLSGQYESQLQQN